jgi:CheY-like chemotaxis protein
MAVILIADDKASSRELIRTVLESAGHSVIEAADGLQALDQIRAQKPDLIILDIHMPGMDGIGVTEELQSDPRFAAIPILALTASAMPEDRRRALTAGVTSYMTKPISLSGLRREVARLVAGR